MPRNLKLLGIRPSRKRKGKAVVDAYTDPINHLVGVRTADEEKAKMLITVSSYANGAAAYLLPGVHLNKALADGVASGEGGPHL